MLVEVPAPPCRASTTTCSSSWPAIISWQAVSMAANCGVVPSAQFVIGPGRGQFDRAVGVDQPAMHRPTGQREVFDRPQRVDAPQRVGRHVAGSQQIGFASGISSMHKPCTRIGLDGMQSHQSVEVRILRIIVHGRSVLSDSRRRQSASSHIARGVKPRDSNAQTSNGSRGAATETSAASSGLASWLIYALVPGAYAPGYLLPPLRG